MKTLLVLTQNPEFAEALRAALNPEQYRVLQRSSIEDAEPFLAHGMADACLLEVELTGVQGLWLLEKLRRRAPHCPMLIYAAVKQPEWEEEAYLQGVSHVLTKPIRGRLLNSLLERLWVSLEAPRSVPPPPVKMVQEVPAFRETAPAGAIAGATLTLGVLRDFSSILTHSLNAEAMLKEWLLLLREILNVNRAAIFLRQPVADFHGAPLLEESRRLRLACSVGLSTGLLQHFELSFDAGIGGQLFRLGRIVRRFGEEVRNDPEAQKEFELLGVQAAVPILDRETVIGVAVFDGRL